MSNKAGGYGESSYLKSVSRSKFYLLKKWQLIIESAAVDQLKQLLLSRLKFVDPLQNYLLSCCS